MKQENLNTLKSQLTEEDINALIDIIGHRCRIPTIQRLRSILTYHSSSIQNFGILDRVIKEDGKWFYCAGQSYPDEIRTVRECILGKRY